jgi:hypothetical protein
MKAYIDSKNSELITIGFDPDFARKHMIALGLERWAWIDEKDDRAIPDCWETINLEDADC